MGDAPIIVLDGFTKISPICNAKQPSSQAGKQQASSSRGRKKRERWEFKVLSEADITFIGVVDDETQGRFIRQL